MYYFFKALKNLWWHNDIRFISNYYNQAKSLDDKIFQQKRAQHNITLESSPFLKQVLILML